MGVKFDGTANTGLTTTLGARTIYLVDALAADGIDGSAQIMGAAPSVSTMATGWTLPTISGNEFSEMVYATNQGAGTFGSSTLPSGAPALTGDSFVSPQVTGYFTSAAWTISVGVLVSGGTAPTGSANLNVRIWHSPDGAAFTEITAGATSLGTINLGVTSQQNTTITTAALAAVNLANEQLYFQFALEVQTGAVATGAVVNLVQDGTNSIVTTPAFSAAMAQANHSMCCFYYSGTLPASGVGCPIWNQANTQQGSFTQFNQLFIAGGTSTANFGYSNITGITNAALNSLRANQWYFAALVVSGVNAWLYWKEVGRPTSTVVTAANATSFTPAELDIGTDGTGGSGGDFDNGAVCSVRVWLSQLSQADIERESRSMVPVRTADLWEHWPLLSDIDYVGHIQGITLAPNGLASSNTPFAQPPLAYPAKRVRR